MVLGLLAKQYPLDEVIYYDNGMDFAAIRSVVFDQIKPLLDERGIPLTVLRPKNEFLYDMLERPIKYKDKEGYHYGFQWCGGPVRWGTRFKTDEINRYTRTLGDCVQYVGIAADEARRTKPGKLYPLIEWGWTEADCLNYCRANGIRWTEHTPSGDIDLYDILDRVSCWCCANKNLKELRAMYIHLPEHWQALKDLQAKIPRPLKPYGTVFDLERRFEQERRTPDD